MLSNLMATREVSDMDPLINIAFQCLSVFNLDLRKVYDQVFNLMSLEKVFGSGGCFGEIIVE